MSETRKIAAILVADVVGYSRLAGADEDRTLSRLRGLRSDLTVDAHRGRIVKRTGDGSLIEFRSVVDAVRCAIEVQSGLVERNAGVPRERRIEFRVGIHLGDVVEEADGDQEHRRAGPSSHLLAQGQKGVAPQSLMTSPIGSQPSPLNERQPASGRGPRLSGFFAVVFTVECRFDDRPEPIPLQWDARRGHPKYATDTRRDKRGAGHSAGESDVFGLHPVITLRDGG